MADPPAANSLEFRGAVPIEYSYNGLAMQKTMTGTRAIWVDASRLQHRGAKMSNLSRLLLLLLISHVLGPQPACAVVRVQGEATSVQIVAHQAQVSEVLSELSKTVDMRYDMSPDLDTAINGTYRGPLEDVLARVLSGYNYIIGNREGRFEVIVIDRVGTAAAPPPQPQALPENKDPAAQWRLNLPEAKKP